MLFASDYPHWDMDEPHNAVPRSLGDELRARVFSGTADELYGFGAA
jgi:predicted TIM-barrel fold metal-dependent hydrolase